MTLPALPPLEFLTDNPIAVLRSTRPLIVPPREWTPLMWDTVLTDTHAGFNRADRGAWTVPRDGAYQAAVTPLEVEYRRSLVFEFAVTVDGTPTAGISQFLHEDTQDRRRGDEPPLMHARMPYSAAFRATAGRRCSLVVRHSADHALILGADGPIDWSVLYLSNGEGWQP